MTPIKRYLQIKLNSPKTPQAQFAIKWLEDNERDHPGALRAFLLEDLDALGVQLTEGELKIMTITDLTYLWWSKLRGA